MRVNWSMVCALTLIGVTIGIGLNNIQAGGQPPHFKLTNRCFVGGRYIDCPSPEQAPIQKERQMKYTVVVAIPVSVSADGTRRHVQIETHELTGYTGPHARTDVEAAVRRACSNRCDIRSVTEEEEK